ncbi:MAG TPA: phosphoenolpyruvate--protein phosphotransferase [Kofleriaceae bacterium]|jgi:phosphotransferase system enzyme I (PtsI)|nr:phosphoenolpyruvate--protein phosphotransferase [Kofleriaceae bacterium]
MSESRHEVRRQGLGVSPGIAFGRAYLIGRDTLKAPRHHIELDDVDTEVARLYKAIAASDKQLARIKERLASENESDYHIITAHQMMLHDEHLVGAAVGYIRGELINAEWGLRRAVDDIAGVFDRMQDDYLRERRSDVEFVFERVLRSLLGRETGPVLPPPDAIVVAYDLSPADTAQLHKAAVAGMITDAGGKTSHTAIIARAHEIPAVVGLENITELVETDDRLLIDGGSGIVIVNPTPSTVAEFRDEQRRQVAVSATLHALRDLPGVTLDGAGIELMCNIDGPDEIEDALDYGAMGVGLFRTEYLFMNRADPPDEERHYQTAVDVLRRLGGKPATIRTYDLGADKLAPFLEEAELQEVNPALGLRSIRLCLSQIGRPMFKAQLRGLLRASAHGPLKIMFPMISGVAELRAAKAVVDEIKLELQQEGQAFDEHVKLGIMIEMPSAALSAEFLAEECDFFSIGTNDLIQYTMAVDRVNEYVSYLYEPLHPSLLRLLGEVARAAHRVGIPVAVCGEMAGEPMISPVLIGLGIRELSMSAVSVPEVKALIRSTRTPETEALVQRISRLGTAAEVRAMVADYVFGLTPHPGAKGRV